MVIVIPGTSWEPGVNNSVDGVGRDHLPGSEGFRVGSAECGLRLVEKRSLNVPLKSSMLPFDGETATTWRPDLELDPDELGFGRDEVAPPWPWVLVKFFLDTVFGWARAGRAPAEKAKAATGTLAESTSTSAPSMSSRRRAGCSERSVATADSVL
jgi:hypothetical protein